MHLRCCRLTHWHWISRVSQMRVRSCKPPAQLWLHEVYSLQVDHVPPYNLIEIKQYILDVSILVRYYIHQYVYDTVNHTMRLALVIVIEWLCGLSRWYFCKYLYRNMNTIFETVLVVLMHKPRFWIKSFTLIVSLFLYNHFPKMHKLTVLWFTVILP